MASERSSICYGASGASLFGGSAPKPPTAFRRFASARCARFAHRRHYGASGASLLGGGGRVLSFWPSFSRLAALGPVELRGGTAWLGLMR